MIRVRRRKFVRFRREAEVSKMHSRLRSVMIASGTALVVNVLWLTAGSMSGQTPAPAPGAQAAYRAPRAPDGHPDLNGIWQAFTTANWDILPHPAEPGLRPDVMGAYGSQPGGQGIVEGDELPYRPEALAQKKKNFDNRMNPKVTNDPHRFYFGDPEIQCYRAGVPRATYMPHPFQIFQNADQIQIVYEFKGALRTVYMNPQIGSGNSVLSGRCPARHLHAPSVSDFSECGSDPDRLRVQGSAPHRLYESSDRIRKFSVIGPVSRAPLTCPIRFRFFRMRIRSRSSTSSRERSAPSI